MNSSKEVFKSSGRKELADRRIKDKEEEIVRLKDTIAEITTENLALKKRLGVEG